MVGNEIKFSKYLNEFIRENYKSVRQFSEKVKVSRASVGYWLKNDSMTFESLVKIVYNEPALYNSVVKYFSDIKKELEKSQQTIIHSELQILQEPEATYTTKQQDKDKIILQLQNQIIELNKLLLTYQKIVNNENINNHSSNTTTSSNK